MKNGVRKILLIDPDAEAYDDQIAPLLTACEMIRFFKSLNPLTPVIVMTAEGSEDLATKVFRGEILQ
jgi:hypothetical protein